MVSVRMWAGGCALYLPEELAKLVFPAMGGGGLAEPVSGGATSLWQHQGLLQ